MQDKISVIIPVHNGGKYIRKTVRGILRQDYPNIELILVENFSSDNSLNVCNELAKQYKEIILLTCHIKGTTFARKKGIEKATGKYIIFSDQDDSYINRSAITNMYKAIVEDQSQMCQFGSYTEYWLGIKRKRRYGNVACRFSRKDFLSSEISGVWGDSNSHFTVQIWSKIFDASVLKSAAEKVDIPLFFCEDLYLNTLVAFEENIKYVSYRPECYYVWKSGIGFSSKSTSGSVLISEYQKPKLLISQLAEQYQLSPEQLYNTHLESIYFFKVFISQLIEEKTSVSIVLDKIAEINHYTYVQNAKNYFLNMPMEKRWEELNFLISDYTSKEYYEYCLFNMPRRSIIQKILRIIKKCNIRTN